VLARLRTVVNPTYDGDVPVDDNGRPLSQRYAVLYVAPGERDVDGLCRSSDLYVYRWQVTSVGLAPQQAEWVAARCRDALLDEQLFVENWQVGVVEHTSSVPIRRDDDVPGGVLFYAIDTYRLPATR
jgi:hypothetical protein